NRRHGARDVRLFEIGTRFRATGESRGVAMAWTGAGSAPHWSAPPREVDFFDVKGLVEHLCSVVDVSVRFEPSRDPLFVAGQAAAILTDDAGASSVTVGIAGQLAPLAAEARGLPRQDKVFVAELDLDALARARAPRDEAVAALPRYPSVVRDLSIVVADSLPAAIIRGTIQAAGGAARAPLAGIAFFDRYQGKGVPDGKVSLSVRLTFQAPDRTLTDVEVQDSFDRVLAALGQQHGAVQR